jgi:hypothetical protein
MIQDLLESPPREHSECIGHHNRVFDTGNGFHGATAFPVGLDVDIEHSLLVEPGSTEAPLQRGFVFMTGMLCSGRFYLSRNPASAGFLMYGNVFFPAESVTSL